MPVRTGLCPEPFMGASFLTRGCKFSHVGASFQLAHPFDKMKSCRHKRDGEQVLNCGCKFSHVGASFPTCTCLRHDEILSPQGDAGIRSSTSSKLEAMILSARSRASSRQRENTSPACRQTRPVAADTSRPPLGSLIFLVLGLAAIARTFRLQAVRTDI